MAELTPKDALQPSLLDRLSDDEPGRGVESRRDRVMDTAQLREAVLRDLSWLLNTNSRGSFDDVDGLTEVTRSVYNYGTPDLCGVNASYVKGTQSRIEASIRDAIRVFEPRVLQSGLSIRVLNQPGRHGPTSVILEIEGEIWGQVVPDRLYLRTEIDLDTGETALRGGRRG
ncbi:MAG: type VI secretion system baseplate subunit TssE [Phycisphaerales bacterium]|nr:type VI secretion system baseplate subunit TssE [Phycisphaerales bacterium]